MSGAWSDTDDLARQGYELRLLRREQIARLNTRYDERVGIRVERDILDMARDVIIVLAELLRRSADRGESR